MSWAQTRPGAVRGSTLMPVSGEVMRIASRLPPEPRVVFKQPKIPGFSTPSAKRSRFSDDDVTSAFVLRELGIRMEAIAAAIGCKVGTLRQWFSGTNRGHLA